MKLNSNTSLTYCTNVYPSESLDEVIDMLENHVTAVKNNLLKSQAFYGQNFYDMPFAVGLRLSAQAAYELEDNDKLHEFLALLNRHQLFVETINAFPYGKFHHEAVKEKVYLPDWRMPERLAYTTSVAKTLCQLLPQDSLTGVISTVPLGFKAAFSCQDALPQAIDTLIEQVARLVELYQSTKKIIVLALEPEPCCVLETIDEVVDFFNHHWRSQSTHQKFQQRLGIDADQAEQYMNQHLGICLDLCHSAVEFEDPHQTLELLAENNISIAKVQISNGLQLNPKNPELHEELKQYNDGIYLHQVVSKANNNTLHRYHDMNEIYDNAYFNTAKDVLKKSHTHSDTPYSAQEWRVHFHVPVNLSTVNGLTTTQSFTKKILSAHKKQALTQQLEIETYTWPVLPKNTQALSVDDGITKEIQWVMKELAL